MESDKCAILSTFLSSNARLTPDFLEMKRLSSGWTKAISHPLDTLLSYKIKNGFKFESHLSVVKLGNLSRTWTSRHNFLCLLNFVPKGHFHLVNGCSDIIFPYSKMLLLNIYLSKQKCFDSNGIVTTYNFKIMERKST